MQIHNAIITGSFSYNGADLSNVTSSNAYSASLSSRTTNLESTSSVLVGASSSFSSILSSVSSSQQQISASLLQVSASYISLSGSYNTFSGSASTRITVDSASLLQVSASQQQISASLLNVIAIGATTGSNSFRANQSITGSLVVSSTITAQTLVVQTVTSSILYSSGSNLFGNQLANTQTFTGSVNITGSLTVNTTGTEFQVTNNGIVMGNLLADAHSVTGSLRVTGSNHSIFGNVLIGSATAAGTERFGVTRDDGVTDGLHIIADFNRSGASSAELILGYYASGSAVTGPVVYAANSQPLLFAAGSVERMRITSGGLVGIGTVSPLGTGGTEQTLHLSSGAANYTTLYVTNGANSVKAIVATQSSQGVGLFGMQSNHPALFVTNDTERMRITSAGQIGINTTSPVSTSLTGSITIYKAYNADGASVPSTTAQTYYSNQHGLYLFGRNSGLSIISANSEEGSIKFGNASTNVYATIGTTTGTSAVGGDMIFRVGSDTERMRITSAGSTCFYGTVLSTAPSNGYNFRGLGFSTGAIATGGSCLIYSSLDRGLYLISIASSVTSTYGYSAFLWVDSGNITVSSVIRQACVGITTSGRALCVVNQYGSETAIMTVTTLNLLNYIG